MPTTLYKPSGLTVFPPHADPDGDCLLRRLLADEPARRSQAWPDGFHGGIAHRLDTWTSGALWVADDPDELARMRGWFGSGVLQKIYRFEACKDVPWEDNHIARPLAHHRKNRRKMVVMRGANTPHRGRWISASTRFERLSGSLWQATITTGVMHQIRVHAAFVGIPLAGDPLYGKGAPPFRLHHVGFDSPLGPTEPVEMPAWAAG